MQTLRWRSPDRPLHIHSLKMVVEGDYLAQKKLDGHFAVIIKDKGQIEVMSRHGKRLTHVSPKMYEMLAGIGMSDGDVLHAEWTSLRQANTKEEMYLFAQVYSKYEWLGTAKEEDRYNRLYSLTPVGSVSIVQAVTTGYADMYRSTIDDWKYEGIVLKKRDTKLFGDLKAPKDNPGFLKLKWRDGPDGMTKCVVPDENLICKVV